MLPRVSSSRVGWWSLAVGVWLLAFAARALLLLRGGGLAGLHAYDDGVYHVAAVAWLHGRAPYDQFVLLHPPGLLYLLAPFAALGELTTDSLGLQAARVGFMALGALNAVLVLLVGRHFSTVAGVVAGVLYAVAYPAMYTERTVSLEGPSSTLLLVAVLLLLHRAPGRLAGVSRSQVLLAGAALGVMLGLKIWNVVPLAVIAGWVFLRWGRTAGVRLLGSAAAATTAVCLPFFVQAPEAMWRYVVLDQIGRPRADRSVIFRLERMFGLQVTLSGQPQAVHRLALAAAVLLVLAAAVIALTVPVARMFVLLLLATTAVLLSTPSFFAHYATLTAAPGVLVLAVAAGVVAGWLRRRAPRPVAWAVAATGLAVLAVGSEPALTRGVGQPFPRQLAGAAATVEGCVTADDPASLALVNTLSRDLSAGCRIWVDVTGLTYDEAGGGGRGKPLRRTTNAVWQGKVMDYLLSGSATVVTRTGTGLSPENRALIRSLPVIAKVGRVALRRVPDPLPGTRPGPAQSAPVPRGLPRPVGASYPLLAVHR